MEGFVLACRVRRRRLHGLEGADYRVRMSHGARKRHAGAARQEAAQDRCGETGRVLGDARGQPGDGGFAFPLSGQARAPHPVVGEEKIGRAHV